MSWVVVLFCILFLVPSFYSSSLTTSLVVCNLCYEGSLVAASCNSLCLMKNGLYSPIAKKMHDLQPSTILCEVVLESRKMFVRVLFAKEVYFSNIF